MTGVQTCALPIFSADGGRSCALPASSHARPTRAQIIALRGETRTVPNVAGFPSQHYNGPTSWGIERTGEVKHVYA